ncbi:branched-chain amino acid ABC transporter permease [Candidatus Hecatella orcuttiae]|jgi:branched-chain amino acid transport system permease protein|uniref:branched-chain amino acid ABC transporter permease n=1 Tax=Candidatus Hecatella orcuttiae TaxID=1935119 RepID=UPI0028681D98|nr:branched-chain amino acid ABC transporter permease [Candidatus Hecatella orcuttiae]
MPKFRSIPLGRFGNVYVLTIICFAILTAMFMVGLIGAYISSLIIFLMVYIVLAISWSILSGYAGEFTFGHIGFFGVGGYTVALLSFHNIDIVIPFNILLGGCMAALFALIVAYPLLHIRGWYFALGTWAVAEIARTLILGFPAVTNAGAGIFVEHPYPPAFDYFGALILGFSAIIVFYKIINSRLGLAFVSVRDNYDAARMMGINTTLYRTIAFMIHAFLAGLAGGFFAQYKVFVDPYSAFEFSWIFKVIVMAVIGGASTFAGPIVGAVLVLIFEEIGKTFFMRGSLLLMAIMLVVVFRFMPEGIVGALSGRSSAPIFFKKIQRLLKRESS